MPDSHRELMHICQRFCPAGGFCRLLIRLSDDRTECRGRVWDSGLKKGNCLLARLLRVESNTALRKSRRIAATTGSYDLGDDQIKCGHSAPENWRYVFENSFTDQSLRLEEMSWPYQREGSQRLDRVSATVIMPLNHVNWQSVLSVAR
jgi:hypothetical protein